MASNKRTSEAAWSEAKKWWRVCVSRNGERRDFYSNTPGRKGKLEAEAKADAWFGEYMSAETTFSKAWADFVAYRKEHASKDSYLKDESIGRLYLVPTIGKKKLSKIVGQDWQDCVLSGFDNGLSKRSCQNIRAVITTFVLHCDMQGIHVTPARHITIPKSAPVGKRKILQPADLKVLFTESTITHYRKEKPCMLIHACRLIVLTGVRRGELCGLQKEDVDGNALFLQRSINKHCDETSGKTDAARRYAALSEYALGVLKEQKQMLKDMGIISPWLFPDERGERLDPNHLYKIWYTYRKQHGIQSSLHELRHTFVSLVKVDMPEALLRSMVGHVESMDTLGIYAHRVDGDITRTAAIIDDVFGRLL